MTADELVPGVLAEIDYNHVVVCDREQVLAMLELIPAYEEHYAPIIEFATGQLHWCRREIVEGPLTPLEPGSFVTAPLEGLWLPDLEIYNAEWKNSPQSRLMLNIPDAPNAGAVFGLFFVDAVECVWWVSHLKAVK